MKRQLIFFLLTGFSIIISCNKDNSEDNLGNSNKCYQIGDRAYGGIIFYLDPNDCKHGMVCAITDQSSSMIFSPEHDAGGSPYNWSMAPHDERIGSGYSNTDYLSALLTKPNAANTCISYRGGGYNDWFLPSLNEFKEMCKVGGSIGLDPSKYYWNSSDMPIFNSHNSPNALSFNCTGYNQSSEAAVRAIRNF